jgi:hypothetical protein
MEMQIMDDTIYIVLAAILAFGAFYLFVIEPRSKVHDL